MKNQIECETVGLHLEQLESLLSDIKKGSDISEDLAKSLRVCLKAIVTGGDKAEGWIAYRLLSTAEAQHWKKPAEATLAEYKNKLYAKAELCGLDIGAIGAYWDSVSDELKQRVIERKERKKLEEKNRRQQINSKPQEWESAEFLESAF